MCRYVTSQVYYLIAIIFCWKKLRKTWHVYAALRAVFPTRPREIWVGVNVRMIANWKTIKYSVDGAMVLPRRSIVAKKVQRDATYKREVTNRAANMRSNEKAEKYKKIESRDYCLAFEFLPGVDDKPSRLLWQHGNSYTTAALSTSTWWKRAAYSIAFSIRYSRGDPLYKTLSLVTDYTVANAAVRDATSMITTVARGRWG